jgi:hypothetical protein
MLKVGDHAIQGEEAYEGLVAGTGTPPRFRGSYAWLSLMAGTCHFSPCERGETPIILQRLLLSVEVQGALEEPIMEDWPDDNLAKDISPVGVAAVVLYVLGLICLAVGLGVPA